MRKFFELLLAAYSIRRPQTQRRKCKTEGVYVLKQVILPELHASANGAS